MNIDWKIVNEMLECAESWVPEARLIGNVQAGDIAKVCRAMLEEGQKTSHNTQIMPCQVPNCKNEATVHLCELHWEDLPL